MKHAQSRSRIAGLRQSGSLKCLFPRGDGPGLEAVLVNTAGGITGGDRFAIDVDAGPNTSLTLTTQAAERAYRAQPSETGRLGNRIAVAPGARINWLPQETILFHGSSLDRSLVVNLAPGASALVCEPLIFGRIAMGEELRAGRFRDRIEIRREGRPLYLDAMELSGDIAAHLDRPHTAAGSRSMASLVYAAPDAEVHLRAIRNILPPRAGASLLRPDVLALRLLAADGLALRQSLIPVLTLLLQEDLPRCWMI